MQKIWNLLPFGRGCCFRYYDDPERPGVRWTAFLVFSPDQFEYEKEQESGPHVRSREPSMEPLRLRNPEQMLDAFGSGLGKPNSRATICNRDRNDARKTPGMKFGRGLAGMSKPIRALDGKLQFAREDERTIVRCSLPIRRSRELNGSITGGLYTIQVSGPNETLPPGQL